MKDYTQINCGQAYDTIGNEIEGQLRANETLELRFVRTPGTEVTYTSYALQKVGNNVPLIRGFEFIDVGNRKALKGILEANLDKDSLPEEIRVIQPNWARSMWGVFFKR